MKKKVIIIISVISIICILVLSFFLWRYLRVKYAKVEVELTEMRQIPFLKEAKVSDFLVSINGKLTEDIKIDTTKIGKQEITFSFINNQKIKVSSKVDVEVVDITPPLVQLGSAYSVRVGDKDFIESIFCGDDITKKPKCYIEGQYDINKVGKYPVTFVAVDDSGNETRKDFTLKVHNNKNISSYGSSSGTTPYSNIVKKYKNDNTMVGIDVSKWQGDIDFSKLKEQGVEFIFIRVGTKTGTNGEYVLDSKFEKNIKKANEVGIPVGVYFYTYAGSIKETLEDAEWVLSQIKPYKVDLPVVYDFEDWKNFSFYNISFWDLTNIAKAFLNKIEDEGYQAMHYSSKYYLENVWFDIPYPLWLAHYTEATDYNKEYKYWQLCDDAKLAGINAPVDVNIYYKN